MGDNTAIVIIGIFLIFLIIFLGLVWWLKQRRDWEEFLRKAQREEAERKRQEQERIEKLNSEVGLAVRKLAVESIKETALKMGLKINGIYFDFKQFNIDKIEGFIDESPQGIESTIDDLFKKASIVFFKKKLKELIERNPKYYNTSFDINDDSPHLNTDNPFASSFRKYFTHKHIELGSYIKRRSFTRKERQYIFQRDNYTCQVCGYISPQGWFLEIDHIYPIRYGGSNRPDNLQTLCETCNRRKGAKIIET